MSVEAAAKHINETFVDYSKMSKYERPIKQYLMPFYIWQTRMPSVMLKKAIEQPVFFTKLAQLQNDMGKMLEVDRRFAPQYESTSEGLPWVTPTDWGKFIKGKALGDDVPVKFIAMEHRLSNFPLSCSRIIPTSISDQLSSILERLQDFWEWICQRRVSMFLSMWLES